MFLGRVSDGLILTLPGGDSREFVGSPVNVSDLGGGGSAAPFPFTPAVGKEAT